MIFVGLIAIWTVGIVTGWQAKTHRVEQAEYAAEEKRDAEWDREHAIGLGHGYKTSGAHVVSPPKNAPPSSGIR